jgi:hypothetical protein
LYKKSRLSFKNAFAITGTSSHLIRNVKKISSNKNVQLIRTGINLQFIDEIYKENSHSEVINILSPRSMLDGFNIEVILSSFQRLIKKYQDKEIHLHLIDGFNNTISNNLKEFVIKNKIEQKVFFYPFLDYKNLISLYRKIDIVIMIPDSDGTPNSGIESMYLKKILIVGNSKYDNNIFNKNTCWQIKNNSTEDLFNVLSGIIELPKTDISHKLSFAKETIVKQANIKDQLKKVNLIYSKIINDE